MNLLVLTDRRTVARTAGDKTFLATEPLLAPDRAAAPPRLICHWHRDEAGSLACSWEHDIAPNSHERPASVRSDEPSVRRAA